MARRKFNGNDFSEDGWPYVDEGSCTWIVVPGTNPTVHLQIQNGPPLIIMGAFAADINAYIERVRDGDSACWTPGNSVATSNHPGGTAMDIDWELHPFEQRGSFNPAQLATIQELLNFYEGMIFWAGVDWSKGGWGSPIDEMHWQMGYDTYDQDNDRPFPKVFDFIQRKIRSDGFSAFRREGVPVPPPPPPISAIATILARATGLELDRATEILPTVSSGLQASQCINVNRIAMWLAQCGEESAGFSTTEEFASGAEYEGRCSDLGNCSPGDGVKYKGRTWIQITGKAHYREFSQWAFDKGFVHSPTQFVDDPGSLGDLRWAGVGAAWYWTVSRPDINELSDAGDVVTVTHRINGGEHGLADRQNRYARAHALGNQLLALTTAAPGPLPPGKDDWLDMPNNQEKLDAIYNAFFNPEPPENIYREASEIVGQNLVDSIRSTLSMTYEGVVERLALLGEQASIDKVVRVARGQGPEQRPWAIQRAALIWQKGRAGSTPSVATNAMPTPIAMIPTAPDRRELDNAYAEIARLRAENEQLRRVPAPLVSTEVAKIEPVAKTSGELAGKIIDTVEDWADAAVDMNDKQKAALAASIQVLQIRNGTHQ